MIETMKCAHGVGLAANQIGISQHLCVIDISVKEEEVPLIVLINPVIVEKTGLIEAEEGCLSVPGYMTTIKRPRKGIYSGVEQGGQRDGNRSRRAPREGIAA